MQAFEISDFGLIAGGGEGFKAGLNQSCKSAAEDDLFSEEVCFGFFFVCSFDDSCSCAADTVCPGQCDFFSVAGGVLLDSYQAGYSAAFFVFASDEVAGAFGGYHNDIDVLWRDDIFEMYVEAVAESERLAGIEVWRYLRFIDLCLDFIGKCDDNQSGVFHSGFDVGRLKSVLFCQLEIVCSFQFCDGNFDTAVAEVLAVGVSL